MRRYNLHSAEDISNLNLITFHRWLQFLYKNPTKFEKPSDETLPPRGIFKPTPAWLYECWCQLNQSHARGASWNLRRKHEERILNAVKYKDKNETVQMLSLGSGGLFQDLMILLKLYYNGYRNINLDCIEIKENQPQQVILKAIVDRLNQNGAAIAVRHFKTIEERNEHFESFENAGCDVVYAIDFDEVYKIISKDFSRRQLSDKRSLAPDEDVYGSLFLHAYAQLKRHPSALFLLTYSFSRMVYSGETSEVYCNDYNHQFEQRMSSYIYHDYYYINANPYSLLAHLSLLREKNKPLLINEEILTDKTRAAFISILNRYRLDYLIASTEEIGTKLDEEAATVLVIDDTIHNPDGADEKLIHPEFKHGYPQVTRNILYAWPKQVRVFNSFNEMKAGQFSQKINQLPADQYIDKVRLGIQNYLDWCRVHARGTRGLSRFSHWAHGKSGIQRGRRLLEWMDRIEEDTDIGNVKEILKRQLKGSGNARHSLSRFIYSALAKDDELETLPDREFEEIRTNVGLI